MRRYLALCAFTLLISCTTATKEEIKEAEKTSYEETRQTLLDKEERNPGMFLSVSGTMKKNLIGQSVVNGKIRNTANIASFKDVEIKLDFYSSTKALLESDRETLYIVVRPGQTEAFKTKYFAPKGTDSVALSIIGAQPAATK